jgi:CelD/BcsL family acetyltransferase involved in cellulose biosynthesis
MELTFETHERVSTLASEWDELADRLGSSPFMRPGWFAAWYGAFARGRVEILAGRRGDALAAVAPLERRRTVLRSATNWHSPLWAPLAEDPEALASLTEAMVERARPWLSLAFVDDGSEELEAIRAATRRFHTRVYTLERCPYVEPRGSFAEYEQRLTTKRRSNLRRLWRRLEEQGRTHLEIYDGRRELSALLAEGFRVEASGWKGERATAIGSSPETRAFYEGIATWAVGRGSLRLAFLKLDGRALAFDFAIEEGGVHALLKTGYDADWRSFAPGVLLRRLMLERAFQEGLESYEFLGDAVEWKREWTDDVRQRVAVEAFRPTLAGQAWWLSWAYARPAARRTVALARRDRSRISS